MRVKLITYLLLITIPLAAGETRLAVKLNNKWGYADETGAIRIAPVYDFAGDFVFDHAVVFKNNKCGIINDEGTLLIDCKYNYLKVINNYFCYARIDSTVKIISLNNKYITGATIVAEEITTLNDTVFASKKGAKYGIINYNGTTIVPIKYDSVFTLKSLLCVQLENKYGLYTNSGKQLIDTLADRNFISIRVKDSLSRAERKGTVVLQLNGLQQYVSSNYDFNNPVLDSIVYIHKKDKIGLIDLRNNKVIHPNYLFLSINKGFILLQNNKEKILYSIKKKKLYPGTYGFFSEDYLIQFQDSVMGLVDLAENIIIPCEYKSITPGNKNFAIVEGDKKLSTFSYAKKKEITKDIDAIYPVTGPATKISKNKRVGLVNSNGELVANPVYLKIKAEYNSAKLYSPNGSLKIISFDANGNITSEEEYKNVKTLTVNLDERETNSSLVVSSQMLGLIAVQNRYGWRRNGAGLWGIDGDSTGARVPFLFDHIKIYDSLDITLASKIIWESTVDKFVTYSLVNHLKRKVLTAHSSLNIHISDFFDSTLAGARTVNYPHDGNKFISIKGKVLFKGAFIGDFKNNLARINIGGKFTRVPVAGSNSVTPPAHYFDEGNKLILPHYKGLNIKGGKWGFINKQGIIVTPAVYDFVYNFCKGRAIVVKNKKYGVIDTNNNVLIEPMYDNIHYLPNSDSTLFVLEYNNKQFGLIACNGNYLGNIEYKQINNFRHGYATAKKGKWGILDTTGQARSEFIYDKLKQCNEELFAAKLKTKWGFIDLNGNWVIQPQYEDAGDFVNGLAYVKTKGRYGFIDKSNTIVIPAIYSRATNFNNAGVAWVIKGLWGLINTKGETIESFKYKNASPFNKYGISIVRKDKEYGLIDSTGKHILKTAYDYISSFNDGYAVVRKNNEYGFVNTSGDVFIKPKYNAAVNFNEGFAAVRSKEGWFYINEKGESITDTIFTRASAFKNGYAVVSVKLAKQSYIDTTGHLAFDPVHAKLSDITIDNLAYARNSGGRYYYINEQGKSYSGKKYNQAMPFHNGYAFIRMGKKWGVIDKYENLIIAPRFDYVSTEGSNVKIAAINSNFGVADSNGKILLEPQYECISYMGKNIFKVERNNIVSYVSKDGTIIYKSAD